MRVIVNFMLRDGMWLVHCIADDAKTVISPMQRIAEQDTLIHLLRYVGANAMVCRTAEVNALKLTALDQERRPDEHAKLTVL